jgi:hypothetical protein
MERRRRDDEFEREREIAPRQAVPAGPVESLLTLQRSAGNAAVARMLSAPGRRTLSRTTIRWNSSDHERIMHILPWKHGWDELIEPALDMLPDNKPRAEDPKLLDPDEKTALSEDYGKVVGWLRTALSSPNVVKMPGRMVGGGQIYQFRYVVPAAQTRRQQQDFTIFVTGLRSFKPGTTELDDRYVIGDAWVETDRQEFLRRRANAGVDYDAWKADQEPAAQ